mgnify:CR=1 FL=1
MKPHGQARGSFLIDPLHHRLKISSKSSAHASGLSALASLAAESAGVPRLLVHVYSESKSRGVLTQADKILNDDLNWN